MVLLAASALAALWMGCVPVDADTDEEEDLDEPEATALQLAHPGATAKALPVANALRAGERPAALVAAGSSTADVRGPVKTNPEDGNPTRDPAPEPWKPPMKP